jgi:carboxypeptidase C (cathepsin A)
MPLFLTGESFAGKYIPFLAARLLQVRGSLTAAAGERLAHGCCR